MTPQERIEPKILNGSLRARIASGSGRKVQEVNALVDKFSAAQKMMKQMINGGGAPAGMALPPGMPPMPAAPRMGKGPSTPPKKKSRSGNTAKRAVEENS